MEHLGKTGSRFRDLILHGRPQGSARHWEVTEALLACHDADVIAPALGGRSHHRLALYAAAAGHHGRPPSTDANDWARMQHDVGTEAIADSGEALRAFIGFWPSASFQGLTWDQVTSLGWWLPGLTAAADWIGSNVMWFPPRAADLPLAAYFDIARQRAASAVAEAGLATPAPSGAQLFEFAPRPMQAACAEIPLREGPMLAVIEDETGAGKTEAALILAQRMMNAGKGRGLFVALPTMATADAMFGRMQNMVGKMFQSGPSLVLAHGRAGLSVPFHELHGADRANPDEPGCADWLRADRRRALLADVGVGTVDQALMGVLPVRHASLRLFGLSSKILIVDEVHEMGDPCMEQLLPALWHAHASVGGSAVLLTATLPLGLRARLVAAFEAGAGRDCAAPADPAYPALSVAGGAARTDLPRETGRREVMTEWPLVSPPKTVALTGAGRAADRRNLAWMEARGLIREVTGQGLHRIWRPANRKRLGGKPTGNRIAWTSIAPFRMCGRVMRSAPMR